jgi:hypothetical protein
VRRSRGPPGPAPRRARLSPPFPCFEATHWRPWSKLCAHRACQPPVRLARGAGRSSSSSSCSPRSSGTPLTTAEKPGERQGALLREADRSLAGRCRARESGGVIIRPARLPALRARWAPR